MPKFYIKHLTKYQYSGLVSDSVNKIMLYPIDDGFQKLIHQKITTNHETNIKTHFDFFGNTVGSFMIIEPHDELSITSDIEIETTARLFPEDTIAATKQWEVLNQLNSNPTFIDFLNFKTFDGTDAINRMIAKKKLTKLSPYKAALEFCEYIYKHFKYSKGITAVDSKLDEVWKLKAGVCQDFTNILLQILRLLGIPARYVSGYISSNSDTIRGDGATHAWVEAYIPYYGWLGIDPTNNAIANQHYVKLAIGRDYYDCAPVKGIYKGDVKEDLLVQVHVSTKKNNVTDYKILDNTTTLPVNSFQKNKEVLQHIQQQQQ